MNFVVGGDPYMRSAVSLLSIYMLRYSYSQCTNKREFRYMQESIKQHKEGNVNDDKFKLTSGEETH